MDVKEEVLKRAQSAKVASKKMALLDSTRKKIILNAIASAIEKSADEIIFQNSIDVDAAKESGLSSALIDRLTLNKQRVSSLVSSVKEISSLADPIGEVISEWTPPAYDIKIKKIRVPLGVIGMIYESRPNVTVDAAALAIKSGNAIILRGGSEAMNSNHTLVKIMVSAAYEAGLPEGAIQFIETTDRAAIMEMIKLDRLIDLIIPRGSEEMIRYVREHSIVPILAHGKGLCHTYVDKAANLDMALEISVNAKCQRPGVCNAMETLLVHKDVAREFLPRICQAYSSESVEIRGCPITKTIVPEVIAAKETDWETEYLDKIISIKVVDSLEEAIEHINLYGSGHSEAIITDDKSAAEKFLKEVDAAAVFHNASTRLHDGGVFGLGAEIGISTQKLHARGTMGARELTTTKYVIYGKGNVRK